jgi:HK97 gp10 family phage protein
MELDKRPTDPDALRELANSQQAQDACRELATDIRDDARRLAPVRTGNLRRHIVIEEYTDLKTGVEGFAVGWDDKAFYGQMVEQGTEHTTARPHLVPSAIKHGATFTGGDV